MRIASIVTTRLNTKDGTNRGISDIWNALTEAEKKLLISISASRFES